MSSTSPPAGLPEIGEYIAERYNLVRMIGEGGFAVVYEALDTRASGRVAIKVLHPSKSLDTSFANRFRQEVMLCRQLQHPNTIKITDTGQTETGCLYMVMEFINGVQLDAFVRKEGPLAPHRAVKIGEQVLRALSEAHEKGIVHRDLKPPNIMIGNLAGEQDFVKVLDFGIAKALEPEMSQVQTKAGLVFCTPKYAAPEILLSRGVTPAADVYSLGLIMIEMISGQQVVSAPSDAEAIAVVLAPEPIAIPHSVASTPLGDVLRRAVAKNINERYQGARAMLSDLRAMQAQPVAPITGPHQQAGAITAKLGEAYGPPGAELQTRRQMGPPTQPAQPVARGPSKAPIILMAFLLCAILGTAGFLALSHLQAQGDDPAEATTSYEDDEDDAAGEPATPEPEPEVVNWGGRVARSFRDIGAAHPLPTDPQGPELLEQLQLLHTSADESRAVLEYLRSAFIGDEIEEASRAEAREEYLLLVQNLIEVLIELDYCERAGSTRETAFFPASLIAENSAPTISQLSSSVRACHSRLAEANPEWNRRAYQELKITAQQAQLLVADNWNAESDPEERERLLFESAQAGREALAMLTSGLDSESERTQQRYGYLDDLLELTNGTAFALLSLEMDLGATVQFDLAEQAGLPEHLEAQVLEMRTILDQEAGSVAETWAWERYTELLNAATDSYERAHGAASEEEAPAEDAPTENTGAEGG